MTNKEIKVPAISGYLREVREVKYAIEELYLGINKACGELEQLNEIHRKISVALTNIAEVRDILESEYQKEVQNA